MRANVFISNKFNPSSSLGLVTHNYFTSHFKLVYLVFCFAVLNFSNAQSQNSADFYVSEDVQVSGLDQVFTTSAPPKTSTSSAKVFVKENTIISNAEDWHISTPKKQTGIYVVEGTKFHSSENWQITYIKSSLAKAKLAPKTIDERSRLASDKQKSKTKQDDKSQTAFCVKQTPSSLPFLRKGQQTKLVNAAPSIVFQTQDKPNQQDLFTESASALLNFPHLKTNTHSIYFSAEITGYLLPYHFHNRPPPSRV